MTARETSTETLHSAHDKSICQYTFSNPDTQLSDVIQRFTDHLDDESWYKFDESNGDTAITVKNQCSCQHDCCGCAAFTKIVISAKDDTYIAVATVSYNC